MTLFKLWSIRRLKAFGYIQSKLLYSYDETKKAISQLSGVPVKTCLPSTRNVHSAMCPIKGLTQLKQPHCRGAGRRRRLQFECL